MLCQSIRPPNWCTPLFFVGGQISYAIYILQQPVREVFERIEWKSTLLADIAPVGGVGALIVVVAGSYFTEKYYDRPVRRWLVRRLKARAEKRTPPAAATAKA